MTLIMHFINLDQIEIDFLTRTLKYGATVKTEGLITTSMSEGTFEQMLENLSIGAHFNHFEVTLTGGDKGEEKRRGTF